MKRMYTLLLAALMMLSLTACGSKADDPKQQDKEPPQVTEPVQQPEEAEETPKETSALVPEGVVLPDHNVTVTIENDLNDDGYLSVEELEDWVKKHPEDTNKDGIVSEAEAEAAKPAQKPSEKPAEKPSKPSEKPAEKPTPKPEPKPDKPAEKPAPKPDKPAPKPDKPAEKPVTPPAPKPEPKPEPPKPVTPPPAPKPSNPTYDSDDAGIQHKIEEQQKIDPDYVPHSVDENLAGSGLEVAEGGSIIAPDGWWG